MRIAPGRSRRASRIARCGTIRPRSQPGRGRRASRSGCRPAPCAGSGSRRRPACSSHRAAAPGVACCSCASTPRRCCRGTTSPRSLGAAPLLRRAGHAGAGCGVSAGLPRLPRATPQEPAALDTPEHRLDLADHAIPRMAGEDQLAAGSAEHLGALAVGDEIPDRGGQRHGSSAIRACSPSTAAMPSSPTGVCGHREPAAHQREGLHLDPRALPDRHDRGGGAREEGVEIVDEAEHVDARELARQSEHLLARIAAGDLEPQAALAERPPALAQESHEAVHVGVVAVVAEPDDGRRAQPRRRHRLGRGDRRGDPVTGGVVVLAVTLRLVGRRHDHGIGGARHRALPPASRP